MGQALHIKTGLTSQIGTDTLQVVNLDTYTGQATLSIGAGAIATTFNLGTGTGLTALNMGTGAQAKTIQIGSGGATPDTIEIGTPDEATATIHLNGNVTIRGTEDVVGNTTFAEDVTLGNSNDDVIQVKGYMSFVAGTVGSGHINGNLPFTANPSSTRIIQVDQSAAGNGTAIRLWAGGAAAGDNGDGGDILLHFGNPDGTGANASLRFGPVSNVDEDDAYQILATATGNPGLRYAGLANRWELSNDGTNWYPILSSASGPVVQSGTNVNDVLQWNGTEWEDRPEITLPTGATRTIKVATSTTGAGSGMVVLGGQALAASGLAGGNLSIGSGLGDGSGASGNVIVASNTGVNSGNVSIMSGEVTTGTAGVASIAGGAASGIGGVPGNVQIAGGYDSTAAGGTGGYVLITGGTSSNGSMGGVRTWGPFQFNHSSGYSRVDLASANLTYSNDDYFTGTRFFSSSGPGMVWQYKTDGWVITQETAPADGTGGGIAYSAGHGGAASAGAGGDGGVSSLRAGNGGNSAVAQNAGGGGWATLYAGGGGVASGASGNGGHGGDVDIHAANGGASSNGNGGYGGDVNLVPGIKGTGGTAYNGYVAIGNTGLTVSYSMYATSTVAKPLDPSVSGASGGAGFRLHSTGNMQFKNASGDWQDFASGATLPDPTPAYAHLEANASATAWTAVEDITLPSGNRIVKTVQAASGSGGYLRIIAQSAADGGQNNGGTLLMNGGAAGAPAALGKAGYGGQVQLVGANGATVTDVGNAYSGGQGGSALVQAGTGGDHTHAVTSGTGGPGGSLTLNAGQGGFATVGTGGEGGSVAIQAGPGGAGPSDYGAGGSLVVQAGSSNGSAAGVGGDATVRAGGVEDGQGGSLYLETGIATGTGTDGNIYLGNEGAVKIQFGGTASTGYQFQGNTSNRLLAGSDNNTLYMSNATNHKFLIAQAAAGAGKNLYIEAGQGAAAAAGGHLVLRGGTGVTDGAIFLGDTQTSEVYLGAGSGSGFVFIASSGIIQATDQVSAAIIDLPHTTGTRATASRFRIGGTTVSVNVTAANLGTLTAGSSSNADSLHTHTGLSGGVDVVVPLTWGGTVAAKDVVYVASGGIATEALSNGTSTQARGIGVATTSGKVQVAGIATVVCLDAVAAAGVPVYVAPTANLGEVTTSAPTSGFITQVGIATGTCSAGGDLAILLQTAPPIAL